MSEKNYTKEFEQYYLKHEQELINVAPSVLREERKNNGKMNTTGDWLLFIIPFFAGIGFMNTHFIKSEMVNLIVGLIVVVVCFGIAMIIRPYITGKRSITEIDGDIKNFFYVVYEKEGIEGLDKMIK